MLNSKFLEHLVDISNFDRKYRIEFIMRHIKLMNSNIYYNCDYSKIKSFLESSNEYIFKICLLTDSPYFDYLGNSYPVVTASIFPDIKPSELICLYTIDNRIYPRYSILEDKLGLSIVSKRNEKINQIIENSK